MRIAFHTWDPGLWSQKPNSAGGSQWIKALWAYLSSLGHEILWLGQHEPEGAKKIRHARQADIIILFWRWPMHSSYGERNRAQQKQCRIIDAAMLKRIPMLIHDQDHKMLEVEIASLRSAKNVILAAPELEPRPGFKCLMYPNPHKLYDPYVYRSPFTNRWDLIYIGNNYERWEQWLEYVVKPAKLGMSAVCYGNWLEPHPDRQSPEEVKEAAPGVSFPGRLSQHMIIEEYLKADCTVHMAKPSYCETGFVTMRWAEAASAGTLGFIPGEFKHVPEELKECIVQDGKDLFRKYGKMKEKYWLRLVELQQKWVRENMTAQNWVDLIEETARR